MPPSSTSTGSRAKIPTNFSLSSSAKEMHGHSIYCAAWSTDLYKYDGDNTGTRGNSTNQKINNNQSTSSRNSNTSGKSNSSSTHSSSSASTPKKRLVRYMATCGGDHVTIYEIDVVCDDSSTGGGSPPPSSYSSTGEMRLRQAYRDADDEEVFYVCVFGGRGVGRYHDTLPQKRRATTTTTTTKSRRDKGSSPETSSSSSNASSSSLARDATTAAARREPPSIADPKTWGTSENSPQLLCCAGGRGVVKIIDPFRRALVMTLSGHGDEIYDIKFSPKDETLLLTASKDESLRLWNLKNLACIAIFAGQEGHRDAVLSCSFHPWGDRFVSGGMDNTVKIWSLDHLEGVIAASYEHDYLRHDKAVLQRRRLWGMSDDDDDDDVTVPIASSSSLRCPKKAAADSFFHTQYEQLPYFSTNKVHSDYVDCVQFVGDLILSKSTTNTMVLWKADLNDARRNPKKPHPPKSGNVFALKEFTYQDCAIWFVRFRTDETCRLLALGNNVGGIKVWSIDGSTGTSTNSNSKKGAGVVAHLTDKACTSAIRMVAFSPDGRSLVGTCDDATVWKWDAV